MSIRNLPVNERALIYQINGDIIGGFVIERTSTVIRMKDAFRVDEERVIGSAEPIYNREENIGRIEIPISTILRWKIPPRDL